MSRLAMTADIYAGYQPLHHPKAKLISLLVQEIVWRWVQLAR